MLGQNFIQIKNKDLKISKKCKILRIKEKIQGLTEKKTQVMFFRGYRKSG